MAINFPASPADGDTHEGYVWVASENAWRKRSPQLGDLSDINASGVADGEALIYNSSTSKWEPGTAAPSGVNTISSDNINIDFSDNVPLETRAVAGDITFTASNYTSGAKKTIYLEGDTVKRPLTFPASWNFITDKPTAIGAEKKNILDLNSFGTSESTTVAIWLGASAFEPITASGGTETEIVISGITYKLHAFTSSSTFSVSSVGTLGAVDYLVVGGGGAGGRGFSTSASGGGGGAGALRYGQDYSLTIGTYNALVGAGAPAHTTGNLASNGSDSSVFGFISNGGGGGATYDDRPGGANGNASGGGGGGAGGSFQPGGVGGTYGNSGGSHTGSGQSNGSTSSGGGGGASYAGADGVANNRGGNGGDGTDISSLFGTSYGDGGIFAGGGGGGAAAVGGGFGGTGGGANGGPTNSPGSNGTDGTGGGGGGASVHSGGSHNGGAGGSGIVIIRYPITDPN